MNVDLLTTDIEGILSGDSTAPESAEYFELLQADQTSTGSPYC